MSTYLINKGFISSVTSKGITIYDGEQSVLYTFNQTGSLIFTKLRAGWDVAKIVGLLTQKFTTTPHIATQDVNQFVRELVKRKIISAK